MVVVHCHPSQGAWHEKVMATVKDLGLSRAEFQAWLAGGKKARPKASR